MFPRSPLLALAAASMLACAVTWAGPAGAVNTGPVTVTEGVHVVPVHSTVRAGDGRTRVDLAVTLSIHNASASHHLTVRRIDYFDGSGRRIESFATKPIDLAPFATHEVFIAKHDVRGGLGSTFVVGWGAEGPIAEPAIEAVMIGEFANQSYSFVSSGRRVDPDDDTRKP